MNKIKFKILVPEKVVFQAEIDQITVPTTMGQITVLPNHIPLMATVKAGELIIKQDGKEVFMAISSGFLEVKKNKVVVLTESAERAEEIDIKQAEEARTRAQELLQQTKFQEDVDYTYLAAKIEKELARLNVAKRRHSQSMANIEEEIK